MPEKNGKKISRIIRIGWKRPPLAILMAIFCLVILSLNSLIIYKRAADSYKISIQNGEVLAKRLTHTISDHIRLTFSAADLALRRGVDRHYFNALFGNNLNDDMQNNFALWLAETPQISAMMMTDSSGIIKAIYHRDNFSSWMRRNASVKSQDYFSSHLNSDDSDLLHIGWQNSWEGNHSGFVILSRRLNKIDGSFDGVVMVAMNSDYIVNFFDSIKPGKSSGLIIFHNNNSILSYNPDNRLTQTQFLSLIESYKTNPDRVESTIKSGNYSIFSSNFVISSLEYIPVYQLIITTSLPDSEILSSWQSERRNDLLFMGVFMMFIFVIIFFASSFTRQMKQVRLSEKTAILASQAKSEFLANMSHELRTPLNAIIGFSEMLTGGYFGDLNTKQKERINDMNFCGNHLLELINDILEFSKGEAGKAELYEEKIDLTRIIRESVRVFQEKAQKSGIRINISNIPENFPPILADARKIRQILLNLLSNSMKFTGEHGNIDVSCGINESGNIWFSVSDTGSGIEEKDIPKALSAFGQVHNDPTKGGTGLGLPLCKMFAEMHSGRLLLQSIKGLGTKVTITLPGSRIVRTVSSPSPS